MKLVLTTIASLTFLTSTQAGAGEMPIQTNALESIAGNSRVNMNEHVVEHEQTSLLGFGTHTGTAQLNSAVNAGPGHIQLNDNIGSHVSVDRSLWGNVLTAPKSHHLQENFASTVDGNVQLNGNIEFDEQRDKSLLGNSLSLGRDVKTSTQSNGIVIEGLGSGQMNHNELTSIQRNNNGIGAGSWLGSEKVSEQINQVTAMNGRGQVNDNHQVVDQSDVSLVGGSFPGLGLTSKKAHQVNEVFAIEGTANFNTLDVNQKDKSLFGGVFQNQEAVQDNILHGNGDLIGNSMRVSQGGWGLLGKRDDIEGVKAAAEGPVLKRRSASGR